MALWGHTDLTSQHLTSHDLLSITGICSFIAGPQKYPLHLIDRFLRWVTPCHLPTYGFGEEIDEQVLSAGERGCRAPDEIELARGFG